MCPSALKDGQGIKPAVSGWSLTLLTGLKPRMVALRFIHLRTSLPVGQRWRTISLDVCTVVPATSFGWEEQIQMTREIGGGLTEPHSISQAGKVVKAPVVFRTAVLLFLTVFITRSYAALRAADLDWIVWPGYSLGRVHS